MYIKIPFQLVNGNVEQETDVKKSVDHFIDILVSTPFGQFKADLDFGFVFKNHRFENFDEKKRTIANMKDSDPLSDFKITGTSKNPKNFANALKRNIELYEPRMCVNEVKMEYNSQEHNVKLLISGQIKGEKPEDYLHETNFYVW